MSYFYIIEHSSTGKLYAGARVAKNCHPNELLKEDGYITSSKQLILFKDHAHEHIWLSIVSRKEEGGRQTSSFSYFAIR